MSAIQTRSVTNHMLNEERIRQEAVQRIEHYNLLESTFKTDFQTLCDTEIQIYAEIKPLEQEIPMLYGQIINANTDHEVRLQAIRHIVPYDESAYDASLVTLTNTEIPLYEQIQQLKQGIMALEGKLIHIFKEFDQKYKPYREAHGVGLVLLD